MLGEYFLCALFNACLVLALPCDSGKVYRVIASISLTDLRLESPDNSKGEFTVLEASISDSKGLQCHTALYSWKAVFESDQQLYEMILTACSSMEEEQWKMQLHRLASKASMRQLDGHPITPEQYSWLGLELRPIGSVLGQPGTLARRISIQRAATVGSRSAICQVFIKNTHALGDTKDVSQSGLVSVGRSQSLLTTHRIPVLAPRRVDRMRMEHELSKVWTRDLLPYPGMAGNRGDNIIRSSANSVMRKLSRASITGSFSKRSISFPSMTSGRLGEDRDVTEAISEAEKAENGPFPLPSTARGTGKRPGSGTMPKSTSSRYGEQATRNEGHQSGLTSHIITPPNTGSSSAKVTEGDSQIQSRSLRNRWSSPVSLIRSISVEGIRNFFS